MNNCIDKVDILTWKSKTGRIHEQIRDLCAILSGIRYIDRQIDKQIDRQIDRQTDRQTDSQIDKVDILTWKS